MELKNLLYIYSNGKNKTRTRYLISYCHPMREPRGEFALAVMCVFLLHCFRR